MVTRNRLFSVRRTTLKPRNALFYKDSQKLARVLLYCLHNNNNKHHPLNNKNNTKRLQNNKNNKNGDAAN